MKKICYNIDTKKERCYPMKKEICFDMDGTIADLYGVKDWLPKLINNDPTPYAEAKPLVNMARLAKALHKAQKNGYTVKIVSWLSKGGTIEYGKEVAQAKKEWLAKHLPSVKWNEIAIVAYGTPKSTIGNGILFDDEEKNRIEWGKGAYEPQKMFEILAAV